jgi:glycosyltransferase involved in cell wall biosynthesis
VQYLWIGCLESDEEFKTKAQKGYNLASAQVSQKNILQGIEQVSGCLFDSINGSVLPAYPIYADRDIKEVVWHHAGDAYDVSVGYLNDKYINRINCKNAMLEAAEQWIAQRYKGGDMRVVVYSMRSAPMATACYIKKKIPKAKIYLIVTDLPQFMDLGQNKVKKFLKKIDWISIKKMQTQFDGFILYAPKMAEYLAIPDHKWILMEGSYDEIESQDIVANSNGKVLMYSGKLDRQYGIPMLLDAFMSIDDTEIELWLTGGGNAENYIKECALKDRRIKFFGFLPNRDDALKLQQQASLLVNMRLPSEPASAYCFPSKLFEYMATGIPVLSFKLEGIQSEYYQYLITIDDESVEGIKDAIEKGIKLTFDQRSRLGRDARQYILENKNVQQQCKKIFSFMFGL